MNHGRDHGRDSVITSLKCVGCNMFSFAWQRCQRQRAAVTEGMVTDTRQTGRQLREGKSGTSIEGTITDRRQAGRQRCQRQ